MREVLSYATLKAAENEMPRSSYVQTTVGFLLALKTNSKSREDFAREAMNGLTSYGRKDPKSIAKDAFEIADAMIAERDKAE